MDERWIVIPRWEEFQHYKNRDPRWIKNYQRLLANRQYLGLSLRLRGILHGIWMLYAASGRKLGASPAELGLMLGDLTVRTRDLVSLEKAGFVELLLAPRYQDASLEVEKIKKEPVPLTSNGTSVPGKARPVAKATGTHVRDLAPIDFAAVAAAAQARVEAK